MVVGLEEVRGVGAEGGEGGVEAVVGEVALDEEGDLHGGDLLLVLVLAGRGSGGGGVGGAMVAVAVDWWWIRFRSAPAALGMGRTEFDFEPARLEEVLCFQS